MAVLSSVVYNCHTKNYWHVCFLLQVFPFLIDLEEDKFIFESTGTVANLVWRKQIGMTSLWWERSQGTELIPWSCHIIPQLRTTANEDLLFESNQRHQTNFIQASFWPPVPVNTWEYTQYNGCHFWCQLITTGLHMTAQRDEMQLNKLTIRHVVCRGSTD